MMQQIRLLDIPSLFVVSVDVFSLQMAKKPAAPVASSGSAVDGLVGFDIETGGQFDPLGFGRNCPPEQMQW